jgi:hypothetical protein
MRAYVWTVAGILAVTGAIVGGVFWSEARTSERLSGETASVGFVATPTEWYDSGEEENVHGHTLTYAYTVGSDVFTRTLEQITWYDPATTYKVCYNPADANDSRLYPGDHSCGG